MKIAGIKPNSLTNGPGMRYVIFFQGCSHHCPGCQNQHTWDFDSGKYMSVSEIISDIEKNKDIISGITLSGGDPLDQQVQCALLLKAIKKHFPDLSIVVYTGYTYESIIESHKTCLSLIDVLIDGEYKRDLPTKKKFRGSDNQRMLYLSKGKITREE